MRQSTSGDPPPSGVSGTQGNIVQSLYNAGIAGAIAGPLSLNPLGEMPIYGASLAGRSRYNGSNTGGQNRQPGGFPSDESFFTTSLLPGFCPCSGNFGGTYSQGSKGNVESMTICDLNSAICKPFFPPPNPPYTCQAPEKGKR